MTDSKKSSSESVELATMMSVKIARLSGPVWASCVLLVMALLLSVGNLVGTVQATRTLAEILDHGIIEQQPQMGRTQWEDWLGLKHEVTTPRLPGESREAWLARHDEMVRAFLVTFAAEEKK